MKSCLKKLILRHLKSLQKTVLVFKYKNKLNNIIYIIMYMSLRASCLLFAVLNLEDLFLFDQELLNKDLIFIKVFLVVFFDPFQFDLFVSIFLDRNLFVIYFMIFVQ